MSEAADPDDEVTRLRAEVAALREQVAVSGSATTPPPPTGRTGWWRTPLVAVLVVLGALMAPLSVVATWAHDEIGDTDRYVDTVAPLADDPAVQNAITDIITRNIVTRLNLDQATKDALSALSQQGFVPPRAAPLIPALASPLTNAVENFIHDTVARVVESDVFADAWVTANREAHAQAVAVLTGETRNGVEASDDALSINIAPFIDASKELLIDRGFQLAERIPTVNATFVLFQSKDIGTAQKWFAWLDTMARVLPILGLILLATAVMVARDRRRTVITASLAVAVSMLLLGLALNLVRPVYLDAVPADVLPPDAAAVIYDQLVLFVRTALRAILVVALAIAIAAFLMARTGAGATIRTGAAGALASLRERSGVRRGPVSTFVSTYRTFARMLVVALGALVYISIDHPTGSSALVIVVLVVLGIVVVELVAGPRRTDEVATEGSADVPPTVGL
ncbi:hypothetical protein [Mumia sp. Pv 4-285]|uniref:hypothetical protein n=1 Tax=Mumia qirimensis TaxID=3234852 RepID=UPI00351CE9B4